MPRWASDIPVLRLNTGITANTVYRSKPTLYIINIIRIHTILPGFLVSELESSRMILVNHPQKKGQETGGSKVFVELKGICMSLGMSKPPPNITMFQFFSGIEKKVRFIYRRFIFMYIKCVRTLWLTNRFVQKTSVCYLVLFIYCYSIYSYFELAFNLN